MLFEVLAKTCTEDRLEGEHPPQWTRKVIRRIWSQVLEDVEARNVFIRSIMWRSTDILRHVGETGGRGAITFTRKTSCGGCPPERLVLRSVRAADWGKPNRLTLQIGHTPHEQEVLPAEYQMENGRT